MVDLYTGSTYTRQNTVPSQSQTRHDILANSPKLSLKFPCKQVGRILFFNLDKLLCTLIFFILITNNLLCVDKVRRIYTLIKMPGLAYFLNYFVSTMRPFGRTDVKFLLPKRKSCVPEDNDAP